MSRLVWDKIGERLYETGLKKGVLYLADDQGAYPKGIAWNGLTKVTENPSGAETTALYADDVKYLELMSAEEFGMTIEAYMYPDEFMECDGSSELSPGVVIGQQKRKRFGLAYRTSLGNDVANDDYGYKLHLIYGALASPSSKDYETINDSPSAVTFSWEATTTPVNVDGHKPTSTVIIDSTKVSKEKLAAIEDILYGSENKEARLPLPDEIITILSDTVGE